MITYRTGDATNPDNDGVNIICHICNNLGGWGSGFVLAVSRRWVEPESVYRGTKELNLGDVQLVNVEPGLYVANMVAQNGFVSRANPVAVDYAAIEWCLNKLAVKAIEAREYGARWSFSMPRIGCGLGGGDWTRVEPIIERTIGQFPVTVYDYDGA